MEIREACIHQLRKTLEMLENCLKEMPGSMESILDSCIQVRITLLNYEYYVDVNCTEDQLICLCKDRLEVANAKIMAGKLQEGISMMKAAVEFLLEKAPQKAGYVIA